MTNPTMPDILGHPDMFSPLRAAHHAGQETQMYLRSRDIVHRLNQYLQIGIDTKVSLGVEIDDPYVLALEGCKPPDKTGLSIQHLGTEEKLPWQQQ